MQVLAMLADHWTEVKAIYESGLATGNASFQQTAPSWEQWNQSHLQHSRLVVVDGQTVVGWAALTPVSSRSVYSGVAEVSIYISDAHRGRGVGKILLAELITTSEQNNIWTLQAGIFPENIASIKLHEQAGFRQVGYREKIGKMNDRWRDTVLLERRSKVVGW
ncbi:GNAT family N-acetyltransferase [Deminuibacter soli]|uniref:N-acetyltransferase n=1 Tax=Deminuibacter soli TaxID=2291815 RepID=A0A3E1NMJ4_9BACT|nr:GNAT family N-acetyltransferase [Deminuibacter soli]RFM29054.1 N-acetyltransferase [Deminuibacter soli]